MTENIVLKREDLPILSEQLQAIWPKLRAGEYVVEAEQEGERCYEETGSTLARYSDNTALCVTIRPHSTNSAAKIKVMAFKFQHRCTGTQGSFSSSEAGYIEESFRIETAEGKTYVYGPESKNLLDPLPCPYFLQDVRRAGLMIIQQEKNAKELATWERRQDEIKAEDDRTRTQVERRAMVIRDGLTL